jgi:hypothetical protein
MAVTGLIGIISYGMTDFSSAGLSVLIFLGVLAFTMLLGFVLSGYMCRNRYSNLSFMLWLALWCEVVCVTSMLVFFLIAFAIDRPPISLFAILFQILLAGLVFGLCVYVIVLPYMILAFRISFYRQRFHDCFHLPAMASLSTDESEADSPKQNNIRDIGGS